jgi:hypothetical protein
MATAVKKLDLPIGELVEIDAHRHEVVPVRQGDGMALEPPISLISELCGKRGPRPASHGDFEQIAGELLPPDGEG